jgi:hypothetical protein
MIHENIAFFNIEKQAADYDKNRALGIYGWSSFYTYYHRFLNH